MKCVRMLDNSAIVRIPDRLAAIIVTANKAVYVCKGIWKASRQK